MRRHGLRRAAAVALTVAALLGSLATPARADRICVGVGPPVNQQVCVPP